MMPVKNSGCQQILHAEDSDWKSTGNPTNYQSVRD